MKRTSWNELQRLKEVDWAFTDAPTSYLTHDFHPYPARFIPQIPRRLVETLSKPGELVLDPFCGGGTCLVEATLSGRNSVGLDSNPIGVLITGAKTTPLDGSQIRLALDVAKQVSDDRIVLSHNATLFTRAHELPRAPTPNIPNRRHWFSDGVCDELSIMVARIRAVEDVAVRQFCEVAFSAIIVGVSYQDSETRYARRQKEIARGECMTRFVRKVRNMTDAMTEYTRLRHDVAASALVGDARDLSVIESGTCDLVVTSPPYPNAFDYFLYHRHRLFWLGYDPRKVMQSEIGSHLKNQRDGGEIEAFCDDMRKCLREIGRVLKTGRFCCIVIGDSIFRGELFNNAEILTALAVEQGFKPRLTIERPIHMTKRSFSLPARRARVERIVVLQR